MPGSDECLFLFFFFDLYVYLLFIYLGDDFVVDGFVPVGLVGCGGFVMRFWFEYYYFVIGMGVGSVYDELVYVDLFEHLFMDFVY